MQLKRALISLSNKDGVEDLAKGLHERGVEILSTGGTAKAIEAAGVPVTRIAEVTGFPEILGGRVKTLHPKIHGALLARLDEPEHTAELAEHGIQPIGLVAVNLYPFEDTVARQDHSLDDAIENIDIGGPTMIRAAAKNQRYVAVLVDPADYGKVLAELDNGGTIGSETRFQLAVKAFDHVAAYDDAISNYLSSARVDSTQRDAFPPTLNTQWSRKEILRYGENPHQTAAFYVPSTGREALGNFEQLNGKALSYNNFLDTDGAIRLVAEFDETACAIIKHSNPAGCALGDTPEAAFSNALVCDPVSAFGGIIAINRPINGATAAEIVKAFYEVVVAPDFDDDALEALRTKKNLRVLRMPGGFPREPKGTDLRRVAGGLLVQGWDTGGAEATEATCVTEREATEDERAQLEFAWRVCKHIKSNAIVFVKGFATVGVGAGQMSRLDSARLAMEKAKSQDLDLTGSVAASDAFFPFRDGLDVLASAGASAVIQPGGSVRDEEVIAAANEHKIAMLLTNVRHFRH